jgi:hypothetical protein
MLRSSPSLSTTKTNSSLNNTATTTPSATDFGSPQDDQMVVLCDGDAATQAPLYDLGLTEDPSSVLTAPTPDYQHETVVTSTAVSPDTNVDPLTLDFDFDDPIWDQCAAPFPAVLT